MPFRTARLDQRDTEHSIALKRVFEHFAIARFEDVKRQQGVRKKDRARQWHHPYFSWQIYRPILHPWKTTSTRQRRTQHVDRQLSLDVRLVKAGVIERGAAIREQKPRNSAEFPDPHRAHGNVQIFVGDEIDELAKLRWFVGARHDFENVGTVCFRSRRLGAQAEPRWRGSKIMERKNYARMSHSSPREQWFERARETQFHIEVFRMRQKSGKQFAAFLERQIFSAAFVWIARGNDKWRFEDRHFAFESIDDVAKTIETKFEEIRRLAHREGKSQICSRSDYAHDHLARLFDRSTRCHILAGCPTREKRGLLLCSMLARRQELNTQL